MTSKNRKTAKGKSQLIDLGFCPRCKEVIDDLQGLESRAIGEVKFCVFCASHVESDNSELQRYVSWAKNFKAVSR